MGICINYVIRKEQGEPNTAKVVDTMLDFEYAVIDLGFSKYGVDEFTEAQAKRTSYLRYFFNNGRRNEKGNIEVPAGSLYGEDDNYRVAFDKTASVSTERGEYANNHISLNDWLHKMNSEGWLETVYDEEGYFETKDMGKLREGHKEFMETVGIIEDSLKNSEWSGK